MKSEFIHLHNHSDNSLLDGAQNIPSVLETIYDLGMDSVALTEHGNLFGAISFYKKAKDKNIKPIIGCEVYVAKGSRFQKDRSSGMGQYNHLVLIAQNYQGYKNLMKIVTHGYLEGFYYKPRIDTEILKKYNEGIICLSACLKGILPETLIYNGIDAGKKVAEEYSSIFPGRYYIELQNHGIPEELQNIQLATKLAKEMNLPIIATNDAHYAKKEHYKAHDVHICIGTGKQLSDKNRLKYPGNEFYFKSQDEMFSLFKQFPQALENTRTLTDSVNLEIPMEDYHLPWYTIPGDKKSKDVDDHLKLLCTAGLRNKYDGTNAQINERLDYELSVIKKMGFASYFLITADFVQYAKKNKIPVGPGRGSAPGSLVSYALDITNIDPLKHNLIFERFLNPDRISMPDIDIDFCVERRGQVIDYLKSIYGEDSVTQIITFGKMNARAVIRDVGRVMSYSYSEVDKIAKMIPEGPKVTLDKALKQNSDLRTVSQTNYKELIDNAKVLEGMTRHASIHAAGVVVAPDDLTDFVPLYRSSQGDVTTQYDMKELESIGLLKMDFLGLRNLTVIDRTVDLIKKRFNKDINIDDIDMEDSKVYKLFAKGLTVGIFQFESAGMREFLKKLKPKGLDGLIAMNALYRPGPMQNIDKYIKRAHGKEKVEYVHPLLEEVLKETYGIIVYQEQVMQIANIIAGFTLSEADEMRRAIGKKIRSLMDKMAEKFIKGSIKNGLSKAKAKQIFDLIDKFAQYGFNKSHSVAYSYIAYQTGWLKTHYTAEFMSANLTSEMNNTNKVVVLINECRKLSIKVHSPDINKSGINFEPLNDKEISFGLNAVKNVGVKALEQCVEVRAKHGEFKSIFDFISKVDQRLVNKKVLESLILAGAFDSINNNRAQLYEAIDIAVNYGQQIDKQSNKDQINLFGEEENLIKVPKLPIIEDWENQEKLSKEKEVLGLYVSGNPLIKFADTIEELSNYDFSDKKIIKENSIIKIGGAITNFKLHFDKKNQQMAFFNLDCLGGQAEAIIFHDAFDKYKEIIKDNNIVFLVGHTSSQNDFADLKLIVDEVVPINHAKKVLKLNEVNIRLPKNSSKDLMNDIVDLAKSNSGDHSFIVHIPSEKGSERKIVSKKMKVSNNNQFLILLRDLLGESNVWID
ncbi:MAG: DNA polymerase III subunit alpha [Flammeovirgaceae bacterium TMED290]|nr:MAG: DNA polymerase III subunit alpha [Flammeovirgaceae bacterium TMED290]|tara:strand:- start:1856 stop:5278 length:3423 start_codon:yes stop_codon:yes gene_type:complete